MNPTGSHDHHEAHHPHHPHFSQPIEPIRILMTGLIDYAGLFPPAKLGMAQAVEAYARARRGAQAWVLGRFICPASRLREFSESAAALMPGTYATSGYREHGELEEPWRVSVLIDGRLEADLELIGAFNRRHEEEDRGLALADALELKVSRPGEIDEAIERIPDDFYPFFEFPGEVLSGGDVRGYVAALAGHMAAAKIRTGGVTTDAFPTPTRVAAFLLACHRADVPFKATAGLHHPVRAEYPLTYEPGAARGVMHGFLNVFLAAAMVRERGAREEVAARVLEEERAEAFCFTPEGVRFGDLVLDPMQIAHARETFALSYGSCSFEEPVAELRGLGLL
jgi:hypothetical protein